MSRDVEEYLEALYKITQEGKIASTTEIAEHLKVNPKSVTEMLGKLAEEDYVKYSPYEGTSLTEKGLEIGEKITRKHRLLERFLHDVLKIGKFTVHKEACEMEHSLSDEAEVSLCRFLRHPDICPDDGKIIPPCNLQFSSCEECLQRLGGGSGRYRRRGRYRGGLEEVGRRRQNLVSICNLKEGTMGRIVFIRGEHKVIRRLLDMGLTPGTDICVVRIAPFNGPVKVGVRGSELAIGQDIAANVFIEVAKNR